MSKYDTSEAAELWAASRREGADDARIRFESARKLLLELERLAKGANFDAKIEEVEERCFLKIFASMKHAAWVAAHDDGTITLGNNETNELAPLRFDYVTGMFVGEEEDTFRGRAVGEPVRWRAALAVLTEKLAPYLRPKR